jgi:hypothetical protein
MLDPATGLPDRRIFGEAVPVFDGADAFGHADSGENSHPTRAERRLWAIINLLPITS